MSILINTSRLAPKAAAILVLTAGLLVGCGGGDDAVVATVSDTAAMPESATATPEATLSYAKGLAESETSEPATLAQADMLASETAEPDAL